jgi:hypothetical protein
MACAWRTADLGDKYRGFTVASATVTAMGDKRMCDSGDSHFSFPALRPYSRISSCCSGLIAFQCERDCSRARIRDGQ